MKHVPFLFNLVEHDLIEYSIFISVKGNDSAFIQ